MFEAWIGDDAPGRLGLEIAEALRAVSDGGTRLYFMCGNRDFLLGADFCRRAGMVHLEEPHFIDTADGPAMLLHGDTLCTDDEAYQRFRRKVRNPRWQRRILARPVWWRGILARLARVMSRRHTGSSEALIMDVNTDAVENAFRHNQVRRIIHGHTHRLAIHDLQVDQNHCQRIVLGDWNEAGSVLRSDHSGLALMSVARDGGGPIRLRLHETAASLR